MTSNATGNQTTGQTTGQTTSPTGGRVALVTGASGGIGTAIVERLAANGFSVAVHYAGNREKAEEVAESARAFEVPAMVVGADVADEQAVAAMYDEVEQAMGGIDVLVNTAGVMRLSPLAELDLDEFDAMHRTNVRGTFVVVREAARRLRDGGAIINFSSTVVKLALPTYGAYAATKGAVDAITMILAKELRGRDITVNAVAPGPTATPLFLDGKPQEAIDDLAAMPPLERLGQPEDIAETVAHLAGPARWINGQILYANGGIA
ncbi:SDR family oxidoreductase [Nocardioides acrostichi]|uniref:SDR family oxidoreductase n=1 Tax=Nocardioides acrostichi TaxID=2784339 RepID=A0A930UYQ2_9ACTN|nr:SDR family oxidoreductase [Nocardioides acrostichi]MBF4161500.1 SDR family oxidoreductase [Nocardioides acrostichi]